MVLIVVLVVIALLSLAAYTFSEMMFAEHEAAAVHGRMVQAQALAESGLETARLLAALEPAYQQDAGGLYDNPDLFCGVLVFDDGTPYGRGRFTLVAPTFLEDGTSGIRYGLEDESGRLNLHTLLEADRTDENGGRKLLMGLPGMTEEIGDAILDWIDPDDEVRQFGAEINEYAGLDPPYAPKNGPLETVEELLLVRGVTPWLLFGRDANRNGLVDPHEEATPIGEVDESLGSLDRGWSAYLTIHSAERNVRADGQPRINVNNDDLEQLWNELQAAGREEWAGFIIAYRQNGPYRPRNESTRSGGRRGGRGSGDGEEEEELLATAAVEPDFTKPARVKIASLLDLVDARVRLPGERNDETRIMQSPFRSEANGSQMLAEMLDVLTTYPGPAIPGRININAAPRAILLGIPGMNEQIVENLLASREPELFERPERRHATWLLAEGLVTLEEMKEMFPFVTGQGSVYRVQAVGHFDSGGPAARIEAILDATSAPPRLVFWRNLTHLGRGYRPELLGIVP